MRLGLKSGLYGIMFLKRNGFKRFLIIPLIIQLILTICISLSIYYFISHVPFIKGSIEYLNEYYAWLKYLLQFIILLPLLIMSGMLSIILAPTFLGPFLEKYASKVFEDIGYKISTHKSKTTIKNNINHEFSKIFYFLKISILIIICSMLSPFVLGLTSIIGAYLAAWVIICEYMDLIAGLHNIKFKSLLETLKTQKSDVISAGCILTVLATIPIINILVPFIATGTAAYYWNLKHSKL